MILARGLGSGECLGHDEVGGGVDTGWVGGVVVVLGGSGLILTGADVPPALLQL